MLVDIMTAIIGPFDFCTGKPMQVEQITTIIGRISFFSTAVQVRFNHYWPNRVLQMCSEVGVITCTVILVKEEPIHEG